MPPPFNTRSPAILPSEIGDEIDTVVPEEISKVGSPSTIILLLIFELPVTLRVAGSVFPPINLSSPEPSAAAVGIESVAPD